MANAIKHWTWLAPVFGGGLILASLIIELSALLIVVGLVLGVLSAVHHAEVIAHKVGEPFGTFILAIAVTVIELGLIVTVMTAAGENAATLARDTVFAAVMIILNGLVGLCILVGAIRHREQTFQQTGVSASLAALSTLTVLTLVLPNFTQAEVGPLYSSSQLAFVAIVSFLLYATFVSVQTVRHRDYFLPPRPLVANLEIHAPPPSNAAALRSALLLIVCLATVVVLSKMLSPLIERAVFAMGAPPTIVGVVIAALVLLPESLAAVRAAADNRLQTSLNLGLGSALATIGLTIPAIAALSLLWNLPVTMGLDAKGMVLLFLTLVVATLSLGTGRTTILQGAVHLMIFGVYLFTTAVP